MTLIGQCLPSLFGGRKQTEELDLDTISAWKHIQRAPHPREGEGIFSSSYPIIIYNLCQDSGQESPPFKSFLLKGEASFLFFFSSLFHSFFLSSIDPLQSFIHNRVLYLRYYHHLKLILNSNSFLLSKITFQDSSRNTWCLSNGFPVSPFTHHRSRAN